MKILAALIVLAMTTPAFAADYSRERAACEADARHLCSLGDLLSAAFGNPRPVARCLIINKAQISAACRGILRQHRLID